jgi:hypothetical protein
MTSHTRAQRVSVPVDEPLLGGDRYDYADSFEIRVPPADDRSAEAFARLALEESPWPVRALVFVAHRYVLRMRLGPSSSPEHLCGWPIVRSEPDLIQLESTSPVLRRAVILGRRPERDRAAITTYVFFARPALARALWRATGPLHRWVARYLLEHAVASLIAADERVPAR